METLRSQLTQANDALNNTNAAAEAMNDRAQTEARELRAKLADTDRARAEKESEAQALRAQLTQVNTQSEAAQNEVRALRAQLAQAADDHAAHARCTELEQANAALRAKLANLNQCAAALEEQNRTLTAQQTAAAAAAAPAAPPKETEPAARASDLSGEFLSLFDTFASGKTE